MFILRLKKILQQERRPYIAEIGPLMDHGLSVFTTIILSVFREVDSLRQKLLEPGVIKMIEEMSVFSDHVE